ncbi:MAG: amino-acid racemase [Lachnospiraceae bacterium]|nr:amino-acid racemase [Lachnospiraceae bacterium]
MNINEIQTPAILLDFDVLHHNIKKYANEASKYGKQLWPMIKTHKSIELARLQAEYGATGFLCGTLDEAEALCEAGFDNIMYAYPVATKVSIDRVIAISKKCNFILRMDGLDSAKAVGEAAKQANVKINYTLIIDSGLHRFGVEPEQAAEYVKKISEYENLIFKGISTHPGHVYGASCREEVSQYVEDECNAIATAVQKLSDAGYLCEIISSGSTPTFWGAVKDKYINIYHPGNYIFHDAIQMSTETAREEECAVSILASVISHPKEELFICDAGAKCLGLDQGAHGNSSIKGFGVVKGHPELVVYSLSEEVGKIHVEGKTDLKVGDKIRIIPNHSCSSANLTEYYIEVREDTVEKLIKADMRSNSTKKGL